MPKDSSNSNNNDRKYYAILWEQYKLAITLSDKLIARRELSNKIYLTLNTAIVSVVFIDKFNTLILPVLGILFCFLWYSSLKAYKRLNKVKFNIIWELEDILQKEVQLPKKLMKDEWEKVKENNHKSFTEYEKLVPTGFIILYVVGLFN